MLINFSYLCRVNVKIAMNGRTPVALGTGDTPHVTRRPLCHGCSLDNGSVDCRILFDDLATFDITLVDHFL